MGAFIGENPNCWYLGFSRPQQYPNLIRYRSTGDHPTGEKKQHEKVPVGVEVVHQSRHKQKRKDKKRKEQEQQLTQSASQQIPKVIHLHQLGSTTTVKTPKLWDGELDQLMEALNKEARTRKKRKQEKVEKLKA